ncbi:cupin domain-containing protein [Jiulongibacter sp. NS-SX5]|uniref:cupin domain-containing protein n=1 Tax=Jiulongibacter sp. NS-SX5 TaxID=3463854 RepID=UPI004059DBBB
MKSNRPLVPVAFAVAFIFLTGFMLGKRQNPTLETKVISKPTPENEAWGKMFLYLPDSTTTYGLGNVVSGIAEIKPGEEIHPPHQHSEEELLLITEGSGTWIVDGVESQAKKGDLMYSEPWIWHGLKNTSDSTLKFYFIKWNSKGVKIAAHQE